MDKLSSWLFWINVGNSSAVRFTFHKALYTESQLLALETLLCFRKLFFDSLVPRRSLLIRCPREVWMRAGERTLSRPLSRPLSQYWQNTPDFSTILPLVTIFKFKRLCFAKTALRWYGSFKKCQPFS